MVMAHLGGMTWGTRACSDEAAIQTKRRDDRNVVGRRATHSTSELYNVQPGMGAHGRVTLLQLHKALRGRTNATELVAEGVVPVASASSCGALATMKVSPLAAVVATTAPTLKAEAAHTTAA